MADRSNAGLVAQIAPLAAWVAQHAPQLKRTGRWPLQQEDVPANLQFQWALYQQEKGSLISSKHAKCKVYAF